MFKLVVFYALIAISVARPYLDDDDYETPLHHQREALKYQLPIVTKFGGIFENIPALLSQQRKTFFHDNVNVVPANLARFGKNYIGSDVTNAYSAPLFRSYGSSGPLDYGYDDQHW